MATVRATCPDCGDVSFPAPTVTVIAGPVGLHYRFTCPDCDEPRVKSCDMQTMGLLQAAGARVELAGEREGAPVASSGPMTEADIDAFVAALDSPDALDELFGR